MDLLPLLGVPRRAKSFDVYYTVRGVEVISLEEFEDRVHRIEALTAVRNDMYCF